MASDKNGIKRLDGQRTARITASVTRTIRRGRWPLFAENWPISGQVIIHHPASQTRPIAATTPTPAMLRRGGSLLIAKNAAPMTRRIRPTVDHSTSRAPVRSFWT